MPRATVKETSLFSCMRASSLNRAVWQTMRISLTFIAALPARVSLGCVIGLVFGSAGVQAQGLQARISTTSLAPAQIHIELELTNAASRFSFLNSYGDALGLAERISDIEASDSKGSPIAVAKLAPGEFQASHPVKKLSYNMNLTGPPRPALMARVSWLNREHGLLMLGDLLPQPSKETANPSGVSVSVQTPDNWSVSSNAKRVSNNEFRTDDHANTVLLLTRSLREMSRQAGATTLSVAMSHKWPFSENEVIKTVQRIVEEYSEVTGFVLQSNVVVMLIPAPGDAGPEFWSAETRGNTVVILLGKKASRKKVEAMLGLVLSHELFHLWVPNSLQLTGHYDWFFEGFTLYQSLRTGLQLRMISFETYLETIARAYQSYQATAPIQGLSLIEASERRWTSAPRFVYEAGMLVAFAYDLMLNRATNCESRFDELYRKLFSKKSTGHDDANQTIIGLLNEREGMETITQYVQGSRKIDLEDIVSRYGLQFEKDGSRIKLSITKNGEERQRQLLRCIGYRN